MNYSELVALYKSLESTTKKLEKRDLLADFYKKIPQKELKKVVLLSKGAVFAKFEEEDLGIASELIKKVIMSSYGVSEKQFHDAYKRLGDFGRVAEEFSSKKAQRSFSSKKITVDNVFQNIRKLPETEGKGSQQKKMDLIKELLSFATGQEARYIVRTILSEMRIGVGEGTVRDAIAAAFGKEPKEVEDAYNVTMDFGEVAVQAKKGDIIAGITLCRPIRVMLAERSADLETAMKKFEKPAIEYKFDGFRVSLHKKGKTIAIFSRRLDDVTKQFPEIVEMAEKQLSCRNCIVEGEVIAVKDNRPLPFQRLSRRIQRKYDIDKMVKEIPVRVNLFELVYLNGKNLMNSPLKKRWDLLKKTVKETRSFKLAEHIETDNLEKAQRFYSEALEQGQEGVMVKNMEAYYQPGKRVGYWLKVKPIMDPLDLVIIGGTWGTGKRTDWIGSVVLGARDPKKGEFLATGMMGSGLTEKQMGDLTKKIKPLITEESGKTVKIKPNIVVEVGYEEIQKSPKYDTGYALRFPKLLRFRQDEKRPEDTDTVDTIKKLYRQQSGSKS